MGSSNDEQDLAHKGLDSSSQTNSPPGCERAGATGEAAAGPVVITTTDPSINSDHAYLTDQIVNPDRAMVIEASTSRIRESHGSVIPRVYTGVVEHVTPPHDRSVSGKPERDKKSVKAGEEEGRKGSNRSDQHPGKKQHSRKAGRQPGQDREKVQGDSGARRKDPRGRRTSAPSMTRILVFSGLVSLVCGMIGGAGYSHFFGSSKSGDQKGSDSSTDSDSSKKSDSSDSGSDTGSDAGSAKDSEAQSKSDTSSKADNSLDRFAPGPAGSSIPQRFAERRTAEGTGWPGKAIEERDPLRHNPNARTLTASTASTRISSMTLP